mgnify:CR=1 FL=1
MNYHVAFVGNPNVGKSAWINALSNADFKVGTGRGLPLKKRSQCMLGRRQLSYYRPSGYLFLDE